ncbi:DUF2442 domain-containing protein [Geobacter sp. DSM 9736]|uniref:DUF2442 domain-containing protein n=1 Tax=Geobacter sp. DSM 9736 TaxID=1277350 RepID=UPI000B504585|nr:DUF2442 domain-containing protein [Geobacter sp. DSM 9736]SNB45902.1 Protein of unknown function [Geobacter sp. DSM 9736]
MNPRVVEAVCHDNLTISLTFSNGERRKFDVRPYLQYPVYTPLASVPYFLQGKASHGTVEWPNEEDFCPDTLYLESVPDMNSPLGNAA